MEQTTTAPKFTVDTRLDPDRYTRRYKRAARVYVAGAEHLLPVEPTERCTDPECDSPWCKAALAQGDPNLAEVNHTAWRRYVRQATTIQKEWIRQALDLPPEATVRFSSKAGCTMCPCSPGFIVEDGGWQLRDTNTWITVA